MRGRTLNDSFVILDEAQNTTSEQMKMFLTRLGFDSKAVSPATSRRSTCRPRSAAAWSRRSTSSTGVEGIGFMAFSERDVVRHPLVQSIIRAYDARSAPRPTAADGVRARETPKADERAALGPRRALGAAPRRPRPAARGARAGSCAALELRARGALDRARRRRRDRRAQRGAIAARPRADRRARRSRCSRARTPSAAARCSATS